jgi:hypothetical protein
MIDMWNILFVINSYLNLKIDSIIFIDGLDRIVRRKLDETWENWKMSKVSWMGHGAWMGMTWGNIEDGWMGPKHSSRNVTCFGGICLRGLGCLNIEMRIGLFTRTWHVSMNGRFWSSSFVACDFQWLKWMLGLTETWHVSVSICFGVRDVHAWKLALGCFKASYAFSTCRWNNVRGILSPIPLISTQRSKV